MPRFVFAFLFILIASSPAITVAASELGHIADPLANSLMHSGYTGTTEIRVHNDGQGYSKTYGKQSEGAKEPSGDLIFEIGSISKVLTGVMLAHFVETGAINLDDPISKHLPGGVNAPVIGDREITLRDIATHSSGLPRLPEDFRKIEGYEATNPYASYTQEKLLAYISRCTAERPPGVSYVYSNLGTALLGNILALHSGKSYEALLQDLIATPLVLKNFTTELSEEQLTRFIPGYDAKGNAARAWDLAAFNPAGGIRATADDLLAFLMAAMDSGETPLTRAITFSMQPQFEASERLSIGLGWHITDLKDGGEKMFWHNGETGGYHSFAAVLPKSKIAVVVLGNIATDKIDHLGLDLLGAISGRAFRIK